MKQQNCPDKKTSKAWTNQQSHNHEPRPCRKTMQTHQQAQFQAQNEAGMLVPEFVCGVICASSFA
jgi:hypothetical protein